VPLEGVEELLVATLGDTATGQHHDVIGTETGEVVAEALSDHTFNSVPVDSGSGEALGNGETDASDAAVVGASERGEAAGGVPDGVRENELVVAFPNQTVGPRE